MLSLRGGGIRVSSFHRFSVATKSTHSKFYCSFWPLLNSSNCQEAKQTFTNCNGLGMKQYFCSSNATDAADMAIKTANKLDEVGTETTVADEQQRKQEKRSDDNKIFAKKFLRSTGAGGVPTIFSVELKQGRSGIKFFYLNKLTNGRFISPPNILVPEDAYPFVRAMDELLGELARKEGAKLPSTGDRLLFSTGSPGQNYDFKLDLKWQNGRFLVDVGTRRTEAKPEHKERTFWLNLKEFHWLRHAMGEMLAKFDGSQPVDEPPKYPGWLFMDGRPRSSAMARPRQAVAARSRPTMPQQQLQQAEQSNAAASLAQQQQLLQVQLLSQQIQQLRQEMTTLSTRSVPPSIVPVPMPTMMQMPMPQQFIQPGQFVQPMGQGQASDGSQEWPKMAMLVAQMLQAQMQQVPAGNGQPVPRENAMKPASQRMPMPGGNDGYYTGQYQQQSKRRNRVPQYNDSNMDMAPALAQQQQRLGKWQRQAETAERQQPQQQRMKPSMAILEEEEEDFEQADKDGKGVEEDMALDANADMAKSGTSSAESKEAKNAIENANWGELYGWEDGKEEGEGEEKQLKQQQ